MFTAPTSRGGGRAIQASQDGHAIDREALATFNPYRTEHLNRFGKYVSPNRIPEPLDFEMEFPMAA
jgi:hypothetical protein